ALRECASKAELFYLIGNEVSYSTRKNPALQDSPPEAGRASDIFHSAAVRSKAELFYLIGNEVSY
ncbi:MAG: hypothetical protein KHX56_04765, partial [Clostridiales bacterium]|nr:hypothetical protein [Clostridiales bacterium]